MTTFDSMAAMQSSTVTPLPNEMCELTGYYFPGDGGGGPFFWKDDDTEADDSALTVKPNIAKPDGRWKRLYEAPLNVKWFGAEGNNSADDTANLQRAITAASVLGLNCFVPKGTYVTTKPLILWGANNLDATGGVTLIGSSKRDAVIKKITHTVYGSANWPVASHASILGNVDAVIITERRAATGNDGAYNWGVHSITIDSAPPGTHPLFPTVSDRVEWGIYTYQGVGVNISDIIVKADKCMYQRTVYVSDYNQIYMNGYRYGFYMDGACTSVNVRSSYVVGIMDDTAGIAWQLKGRYTSCNNLAADGNKGTVYKFLDWTGAICGLGAESREAKYIFDFDGSQATVDGFTVSRPYAPDAVIFRIARSKVRVKGGFFSWTKEFLDGLKKSDPTQLALPRNFLYQVGPIPSGSTTYPAGSLELSNIHMTFYSPSGSGTDNINYFQTPIDRTLNKAFNIKIENISNNVNSQNQGLINFKSGEIMPYLGRDNRGVAASKVYADVDYFTKALFLDCQSYPDTGKQLSYSSVEAPNVGDVFFENLPASNGAFGWVCVTKGTDTGHSAYLKVPVIVAGNGSNKPTVHLVAGQNYYNSSTGRMEVYDGGSWVDPDAVTAVVRKVRTESSAIVVMATDYTIFVNNTASQAISIPDATTNTGRILIFKKITNNANTVTLTPVAGQTIDAGSTSVLAAFNENRVIQSDGMNWQIIN